MASGAVRSAAGRQLDGAQGLYSQRAVRELPQGPPGSGRVRVLHVRPAHDERRRDQDADRSGCGGGEHPARRLRRLMMSHVLLRPVIAVSLLTALTGCWFSERVEEFGGPTMGSTYTVKYVRSKDSPSVESLKRETDAILAEVDMQMSTYRDDSAIEQFNQTPRSEERRVGKEGR